MDPWISYHSDPAARGCGRQPDRGRREPEYLRVVHDVSVLALEGPMTADISLPAVVLFFEGTGRLPSLQKIVSGLQRGGRRVHVETRERGGFLERTELERSEGAPARGAMG